MRKELIFALSCGYDFQQLQLFFRSLRAVGYSGDVCLFYDQTAPQTLEQLKPFSPILVPFHRVRLKNPFTGKSRAVDGRLRGILNLYIRLLARLPMEDQKRLRLAAQFGARFFHVANTRFVLAHQFLRGTADTYDAVMIADVRDVCFQRNPFEFEIGGKLHVFNEQDSWIGAACPNYREWFTKAYGEEFLSRFHAHPISCCGITIGSRESMLAYLEQMARLICFDQSLEAYLFGLDSAAHNLIVHGQKIAGVVGHNNLEGPVLTMGTMKREQITVRDGVVVDGRGDPINTLHQYDRHPDIQNALETQFLSHPL